MNVISFIGTEWEGFCRRGFQGLGFLNKLKKFDQ
jgi:hypothetical protein